MNLKGTMTLMKVSEKNIARGTAQLHGMDIESVIVIFISGKITDAQKQKIKICICIDKILKAVQWLRQNYKEIGWN